MAKLRLVTILMASALGAGSVAAQPVATPPVAEAAVPATLETLLAAIARFADETAALGAFNDIDPDLVTLVDVGTFVAEAERPQIAAALDGVDPAALHAFLAADPAIMALFDAAAMPVEAVIAVEVDDETGAITLYYSAQP